jgi:uncharacterized protein
MKALGLFILLLAVCLLAGALTAPWLHPLLDARLDPGLHKLIAPLAKLWALPLTILLLLWLGLWSRHALGFGLARAPFLRAMARGWLLGVVMLAPLTGLLLWSGALTFERITADFWGGLAEAALLGLLGGLLIGVIDEGFFRGALYAALRQESGWRMAALGSSLYYACLHFIAPPRWPEGTPADWSSGLHLLADSFHGLLGTQQLDVLIALALVGLLLALIRERQGHLALCIGLHAGWAFAIRVIRKLTRINHRDPNTFWVGDYDGVIGWLAAIYVALLILLVVGWPRLAGALGRLRANPATPVGAHDSPGR